MSVSTYIPDDTKIIHTAYADFVSRQISRPVHVVQYDDGLPVLEVKLFHDGQPYIVPSDADINIKLEKPDGKFVHNPALGCDSTRTIVYFEVTYQMAVLSGEISPVIEVLIGTSVSASSSISIIIDRNPVQKEAMESTSEWAAIQGAVKYAKEAIDAAADASASRSAAFISETNAKDKALEASEAAVSAENSAVIAGQKVTEATTYATSAENSAGVSENYSKLSKSWACGDTGVRAGEDENNSEFYSKLAQQLTDEAQKLLDQAQKIVAASTSGALIPVGTVPFAGLPTNPAVGYMYNISDDFTTDGRFVEGAGIFYRAGANVYWTKDGQWDVMIGTQVTGVKGDLESAYRVGNVNITPDNIGAASSSHTHNYLPLSGGTLTGNLRMGAAIVSHSIIPATDSNYPLGSSDYQYSNVYSKMFRENGVKLSDKYLSIADANTTLGTTDISAIGDGTVTGAISGLNMDLDQIPVIQAGVIMVATTKDGAVDYTVTFPRAFSNVPIITLTPAHATWNPAKVKIKSKDVLGFTGNIYVETGSGNYGINWIAVGT